MVAQLRAGLIVVASTLMMALVVTDTAVVGGIVVVPATEESTGSMGEHTQAVRYQVVVARLLQVVALVEQLQVAGVYGKRLIRVAPNDVTMEDIVHDGPLFALPAKGLKTLAACGVQEPPMEVVVKEQK
jgi:hypothetical protein